MEPTETVSEEPKFVDPTAHMENLFRLIEGSHRGELTALAGLVDILHETLIRVARLEALASIEQEEE